MGTVRGAQCSKWVTALGGLVEVLARPMPALTTSGVRALIWGPSVPVRALVGLRPKHPMKTEALHTRALVVSWPTRAPWARLEWPWYWLP